MDKKISIVIPVFNVEKYLKTCIESIINQDYKNLEIILIDDGSTDKSGKICDEYANKDKRIKVIHQKNKGAANAKNTGLKYATGFYLSFVDSDDYLEPCVYSFMINKMEEHNADMIQCSFNEIYTDKSVQYKQFKENYELDNLSYLKLFTSDWTCGLLWDKLFKRSLFNGIFFEENHKIDDEFFTYKGISNAKKIIRIPKIIYNYRKRLSSVMLSEKSQKQIVLDKIDFLDKRRKFIKQHHPQLINIFDQHFLNMMVILSKDKYSTKESIKKIKIILKSFYKEEHIPVISKSLKIKLLLINIIPTDYILKTINRKKINQNKNLKSYFE